MNIHTSSVVKAGGAAALVGLVLALISAIPVLGCLFAPLACLGAVLLPAGAGLGYGYLAPGKEELGQSAVGGALAGGFSGFAYGFVVGLVSLITGAGTAVMLEDADILAGTASSIVAFVGSLCIPIVTGLIFGAIGGVLWPLIQGERA